MTPPAENYPKNPIIEKYRRRFEKNDPGESFSFAEVAEIFGALVKMENRLAKIAKISDGFQAELQELKESLAHSSRTDYLTGLSNRRDMYEKISGEQSRSHRTGRTFSLVMADLDFFKDINDAHGHAVGDEVLAAIAGILSESVRTEDCCARWGGEEFLILLPETEKENALNAAERLRCQVADYALERKGRRIGITMSFGVSTYRHGEDVEECISRADEALYRAKHAGRNRSVLNAAGL